MLKVIIWKEEEGKKEKFSGEVKCENLLSNELITIIIIINSQMNYSEWKKNYKAIAPHVSPSSELKEKFKTLGMIVIKRLDPNAKYVRNWGTQENSSGLKV